MLSRRFYEAQTEVEDRKGEGNSSIQAGWYN
jgi:hypothetical protein